MTDETIPESRVYVHLQCEQETEVSGQAFEVVSNPMSSMEQTLCSSCGTMFPIDEFVWADTGETISDYYARHSAGATEMQRFLCSKKFMVAIIVVVAVLTGWGGYAFVGNQNLMARLIVAGAGLMIGAMIGMSVFLTLFANPIKRKVCGVSDTRVLR